MEQKRKQYYVVDIVKLGMCIFIIALHCEVHTMFNENVSYWNEKALFRLAVPFFFMTSGFFLGEKINHEDNIGNIKNYFIKYSKRLLQLLLIFEPISILLNIGIYNYQGKNWSEILLRTVRDIIFYPRGALWFVQACIIGVWIIYIFLKYHLEKFIFPISGMLYLFALLCNSYFFIIENTAFGNFIELYLKITASTRNGIFVGFPYLYAGILVSNLNQKNTLSEKRGGLAICMIFGYIFYLLELYLLRDKTMKDDGSLFIALPVFTLFFLLFCLQYSTYKVNDKCLLFRNLSTGMYLLHSPIRSLFEYGTKIIFKENLNKILLFFLTLFFAFLICVISYKSKNRFIKNLLK